MCMTTIYSVPIDLCESNEDADGSLQRFDSIITDFMREQRIPGGSIAVSYNGRVIHRQGYGMTGCGERCLSTSYYRIASISKTITAIAMMQLIEQHKLHLNDRIFCRKGKGILKNFKPVGPSVKALERITVQHLLEHSGGWDRETGLDPVYIPPQTVCPLGDQESISPEELFTNYHVNLIQYMIKQKLDFKPGTRHGYSNFGYLVLGHVIEKITGIPYHIYIHDVINKAGDIDLLVYEGDELHRLHPNEVRYFENSDSTHPSILPYQGEIWTMQYGGFHMQGTGSYGGLVASPLQLLTLLSTLDMEHWKGNRILSEESISRMLACPKFEKGSEWYGLGLDVEDEGQTWGHTGYMDGTTTTFRRDKSGYSWVLLFNAGATDQDLDGLVRFALSSLQLSSNLSGLKYMGENVRNFEISSKDGSQVYHILIPLRDVDGLACAMKSKGYYMQDTDLVVYENEYYVNMIWNLNEANVDWFYKIYHNVVIDDSSTEEDINNHISNGFRIHVFSICTDAMHQSDIYIAVIYMRPRDICRQFTQHITYMREISEQSNLDLKSHGDVIICSVCFYLEKMYVSILSEKFNSRTDNLLLSNNGGKKRSYPTEVMCSQKLNISIHGTKYDPTYGTNMDSRYGSHRTSNSDRVRKKNIKCCSDDEVNNSSIKPRNFDVGEKPSTWVRKDMSEDEFLDELRLQALDHYGLIFFQIYKIPQRKNMLISAVWSKLKVSECYQRIGASRFSFMNELMESSGEITPLERIRAYSEDGVLLFAGIWTAGKFKASCKKSKRGSSHQSPKTIKRPKKNIPALRHLSID